jgi:magnesium transporter
MIKILKSVDNQLAELEKIEEKCWVCVNNPSIDELQKLGNELQIPMDFLTDSLDINERARVEADGDCILIVFRSAIIDETDSDIPYKTIPVGIIFKGEIIISICAKSIEEILDFQSQKTKWFSTQNRNQFLLNFLHRTSYHFLKFLDNIENKANAIETILQKSTKNEELIKLLNLEKSLVYFTTSLKSNELMMQRMSRMKQFNFSEDDLDFLDDTLIDHKQAIDVAEIHSNILSGMMDAFASVISNNLNIVMKLLTGITIMLMIPTLIASIYGMNIKLPFQHSPHAFEFTLGTSALLTLTGILFFFKKHWL